MSDEKKDLTSNSENSSEQQASNSEERPNVFVLVFWRPKSGSSFFSSAFFGLKVTTDEKVDWLRFKSRSSRFFSLPWFECVYVP